MKYTSNMPRKIKNYLVKASFCFIVFPFCLVESKFTLCQLKMTQISKVSQFHFIKFLPNLILIVGHTLLETESYCWGELRRQLLQSKMEAISSSLKILKNVLKYLFNSTMVLQTLIESTPIFFVLFLQIKNLLMYQKIRRDTGSGSKDGFV